MILAACSMKAAFFNGDSVGLVTGGIARFVPVTEADLAAAGVERDDDGSGCFVSKRARDECGGGGGGGGAFIGMIVL